MPFAHVNGTQLYYEIHGDGPPLVLSHGGGANHVSWWQQIPAFAERHTVVVYDHRGFGLSGDNDQATMRFVDDLEALVDHLGFDQVSLLGQSLGGFAVAGYASRHPERVRALILTSSGAGLVPIAVPATADSRPAGEVPLPSYLDTRDFMIRRGKFPERHPGLCFLVWELASFNHRVDLRALGGTVQILHDVQPIAEAGIPTLLIASAEDEMVTETMRRLTDRLPDARFVVLEDADHLVYIEQPEVYNRHVMAFCRDHIPTGATIR